MENTVDVGGGERRGGVGEKMLVVYKHTKGEQHLCY
jgi:hypothetical protein